MPPNDSVTSFRVRTAGAKAGAASQLAADERGVAAGIGRGCRQRRRRRRKAQQLTRVCSGRGGRREERSLPGRACRLRPRRAGAAWPRSSSRTSGSTRWPKYSTSSWKCRKPPRIRFTPDLLEVDDLLGDLLGRADQAGLEAVVVLHQIVEVRVGPHALLVGRRLAGLLHRLAEAMHRLDVGLRDDLAQHVVGLALGLAGDDEGVGTEPDAAAVGGGRRR